MKITAEEIIRKLNLKPLPGEGGYYAETYKSGNWIAPENLPGVYIEKHAISTCIYYLITHDSFSRVHRLPTTEIWHFYLGGPAEQIHLFPNGTGEIVTLGNNIGAGEMPQVIVPGFVWQATRLKPGGGFALFGTTMSPGFEFSDYEPGDEQRLIKEYPDLKAEILRFLAGDGKGEEWKNGKMEGWKNGMLSEAKSRHCGME